MFYRPVCIIIFIKIHRFIFGLEICWFNKIRNQLSNQMFLSKYKTRLNIRFSQGVLVCITFTYIQISPAGNPAKFGRDLEKKNRKKRAGQRLSGSASFVFCIKFKIK